MDTIDRTLYENQYITLEDYDSNVVISNSHCAIEAYYKAIELGYLTPVLLYVTVPSINYINITL